MAVRYTEEQLNTVDKSFLIQMFLNQQEQFQTLTVEVRSPNKKMQLMMEQMVLANRNCFERSSEKMADARRISFMEVDGTIVFFNETEAVCDLDAPEPELLEDIAPRQVKTKGKKDGHMVKAKHPRGLLHGSTVSPTLAAAIINGKYVNAIPLYRLEQEFKRYGLTITRQNMANWMIRLGEEYLSVLYDYLHQKLYDYHVI